ncbi:MAG: sortase [Eubacteriales bacterium]
MAKRFTTKNRFNIKEKWQAMDKNRLLTWLLIALGALLVALIITFAVIWSKGYLAERRATLLLTSYEKEIAASGSNETYSSAEINTDPLAIEGYLVMGTLEIESIDLSLAVIERISDEALRVSVCYYGGALPGEDGNTVITGHNFASGAHFGRLDELKNGDIVTMTLTDGTSYSYEVYDMTIINPSDTKALEVHKGKHALSLLTCIYNGNRRLLVRCRQIDTP